MEKQDQAKFKKHFVWDRDVVERKVSDKMFSPAMLVLSLSFS